MGFVANFMCFPAVQKVLNWVTIDKVIESIKVGTFLRHSVQPPLRLSVFVTCCWRLSRKRTRGPQSSTDLAAGYI